MKAFACVFLIGGVFLSEATGSCQDTFDFRNLSSGFGIDAPIFDGHGNRLTGPNFVAMLYGGPTTDSLGPALTYNLINPVPIQPVPFWAGQGAGYFFGGGVLFNSLAPGSVAWLQVRVWDIRLGQTYDQVASLGLGGYGESSLFQDIGGNPFRSPPSVPGPLFHLQSFSIVPEVPEPSPGVLLLFGALSFLCRGKRRVPDAGTRLRRRSNIAKADGGGKRRKH